eukprot:gnl/Spiro4/15655_TR8414_c0_g1_i1.p1 gnl/Spiro4/15655_TR8414_c0_g1~~gnl/Spiro4/15655_TR8414_c0_g1_i1.p1  ORF type:complete len:262 (+),score=25.52 gnl/Spiro4/15655_TR8414_c0_g1_i1:48-788(+)
MSSLRSESLNYAQNETAFDVRDIPEKALQAKQQMKLWVSKHSRSWDTSLAPIALPRPIGLTYSKPRPRPEPYSASSGFSEGWNCSTQVGSESESAARLQERTQSAAEHSAAASRALLHHHLTPLQKVDELNNAKRQAKLLANKAVQSIMETEGRTQKEAVAFLREIRSRERMRVASRTLVEKLPVEARTARRTRTRIVSHDGVWCERASEENPNKKKMVWSCCMQTKHDAPGCVVRQIIERSLHCL